MPNLRLQNNSPQLNKLHHSGLILGCTGWTEMCPSELKVSYVVFRALIPKLWAVAPWRVVKVPQVGESLFTKKGS